MKKITFLSLVLLFSGCSSVPYAKQPSHVKEYYNENGALVQEFVVGYSIEDFLREFN